MFDRLVDLISRHQVLSLIAAFVLGLNAPAGVRRFARWAVLFVFWVGVLIWMLPVGALALALYVVGIPCGPGQRQSPAP